MPARPSFSLARFRPLRDRATRRPHSEVGRPAAADPDRGRFLSSLRAAAPRIALVWVLFLAFALRVYDIERNPPELFEDELAGAASAWSIVTTGHDVGPTHLPFLVTRLEFKQPIYGFATVPFQAAFGQTIHAVRLPAILFGVLTTWLLYWLARRLGRRPREAIVVAGLFAIVPWAVHYGRIGWEPSSVLPFTVAGAGLLFEGLARHRRRRIVAAAIVFAIGAYAYQPALLLHVAIACALTAPHARHLRRRDLSSLALGALVAGALLIPYLLALADPVFTSRTASISVFREGIDLSALGVAWNHYWAQWDPHFLFFVGTANLRNEPGMGVLLPVLLPVLPLGILALVLRRHAADVGVLGWLVIGPLAAALTNDGVPHFARGIFVLPAIVLACGRGLEAAWMWASGRRGRLRAVLPIVATGLAAAFVVSLAVSYAFYFTDYPRISGGAWRVGTAAGMDLVRDRVPPGSLVCIDPAATSYWTFPQFVAWYLPSSSSRVVEGLGDPRCAAEGSYVLGHADASVPTPASIVAQVTDAAGAPNFVLWRVGGR